MSGDKKTAGSIVYVPEGSFGVLDSGEIPADTADWSNGFVAVMETGVLIATGIHTGNIRVQASPYLTAPSLSSSDAEVWDEIVEVSVQAPHAGLCVESLHDGVIAELPLLSTGGNGPYRLRVHARGRDIAYDQVREQPVEDYLIQAWPAGATTDINILRGSAKIEGALRNRRARPPAHSSSVSETDRNEEMELERLRRGGSPA
ncbi:hypothetical protein [Streptomyces aureocirculatus]|uniref:hypothetical protein n=1 Tax=Streptomyces aureocirculatus TaxID=67275 RepID=UPI0012FE8845|nr:hypothetical protein [Streptomyces aureocirculatus]